MKGIVAETVEAFFGYTTIHGCDRIGGSKYFVQRLFWCLSTLGCMGLTIFQIYRLQQQYTAGKVTTTLDIGLKNVTFPYFRFCNLNPSRYSAVKNASKLMTILYSTQLQTGVNLTDFDKEGQTTVIPDGVKTAAAAYRIHNVTEARSLFGQTLGKVRTDFNSLYPDRTNPYSYEYSDIVISCAFQGQDCESPELGETVQFTAQGDDLYGTCFEVKAHNVPVQIAGPEQGLEMIIYVDHDEYIPFISESIGINTRVYDNENKNTFLEESTDGVRLTTGYEINIAMTLTRYIRLPGKTNRCDTSNKYPNLLTCLEECLSRVIAEVCGCSYTGDVNQDYTPCYNSASLACRKWVRQAIQKHCPGCKQPCIEKKYEKQITMTRWPSRAGEPVVRKLLKDKNKNATVLSDNVLLLRLYYSSLTVQTITEEVAYTDESFVSDIGGQLGLWVGMSVLTLAEVVELGILILIGLCSKKKEEKTLVVPITLNENINKDRQLVFEEL